MPARHLKGNLCLARLILSQCLLTRQELGRNAAAGLFLLVEPPRNFTPVRFADALANMFTLWIQSHRYDNWCANTFRTNGKYFPHMVYEGHAIIAASHPFYWTATS